MYIHRFFFKKSDVCITKAGTIPWVEGLKQLKSFPPNFINFYTIRGFITITIKQRGSSQSQLCRNAGHMYVNFFYQRWIIWNSPKPNMVFFLWKFKPTLLHAVPNGETKYLHKTLKKKNKKKNKKKKLHAKPFMSLTLSDQEIKTQIPHFWARALNSRDCCQFTFTFPLLGIN